MNKNYRIHTNTISDKILNVNMKQDFDFLEILSIKLSQKDAYKLHSSNYGVIIGRVLANDAFGVPNAKISVFIEKEDGDSTDVENIYPYKEVTSKDKSGRRYNLLPDSSDDECYRIVGTFPNKRLVLDDNVYLEVYDKYWKYSTVTNNAGDYMLFAVPTGSHHIHVDIDLSDIGVLSQKPRDFMYKGYTMTLFDSSTQFKESTNLDNLTQIISQNQSVYVYPFWGDAENGIAAITRADVQVNYKFEPTCVFMGAIMSDNEGNSINHKCAANIENGFNRQLVAGEGTIEMIRKTQDGLVEEYSIQGNRLIDSDGVWCYQIPMNLDFVGTDEYGNIIPTDNPSKGIPTRTQVRFRISKTETGGEGHSTHTAKYLVPMNPILSEAESDIIPTTEETTGNEMERMYIFGSNTPQSCFRDLYWNNVYSVKNFIPKTQVARRAWSPNYNALKAGNAVENQNPIPFNKLTVHIPFGYMFICLLFTIIIFIISFINRFIIGPINMLIRVINILCDIKLPFIGRPFGFLCIGYLGCISMSAGLNSDNIAYYPGCDERGMDAAGCPEEMDGCKKSNDDDELLDKIQQNLSQEYDVIRLDLFQDWINGSLYMPLWFWKKSKKKKFLFFTIKSAENTFCDCNKEYSRLKTRYTCSIDYLNNSFGVNRDRVDTGEEKWHKRRETFMYFNNGLIKGVKNNDGLTAYYYVGFQPAEANNDGIRDIKQRNTKFKIVRLFATDIILLGNLNESNIYGIPQLFNNIPSTTANIPPIATIEETDEGDDNSKKYKDNDNDFTESEDEIGTVVTTGIDWGYSGGDDSPVYKKGLFLDLECLYAVVRSKACINVERLSELGVSLDITHLMPYSKSGGIVNGIINSDGFINKFEIDDNNSRAMFATLNHIGFVPQEYQDMHEMYETQVEDENTRYLVPKFKYTYPVDFDGRLYPIMEEYQNGFAQPLLDDADESYITFRLGAEKDLNYKNNSEGRIRHFYEYEGSSNWKSPLFNNSYYFYFGINKGNTAIDKFNSKFVAPCTSNHKKPFTIDITSQGKVECPDMYNIDSYKKPYIKVNVDDIQIPFSYELLDSLNNKVLSESGLTETEILIPDKDSPERSGITIINQTYTIKITDSNGKKLTERVTVETPIVGITYETERLGTKFYSTETTRIDYICNDNNMLYGKIKLKTFALDGYEFDITNIVNYWYDSSTEKYNIILTGKNDLKIDDGTGTQTNLFTGNAAQIVVSLGVVSNKTTNAQSASEGTSTTNGVKNCLCDTTNPVAISQGGSTTMYIKDALATTPYWLGSTNGEKEGTIIPEFFVYQPNNFSLTVSQYCESEIVETNSVSEVLSVLNGEVFNAYLNDMPVRFMLGTINDSENATIANTSYFYNSSVVEDPKNRNIIGWYGVHQEDTYKFSPTTEKNASIWADYVKINSTISDVATRRKIIQYKFDKMFSLSEGTYVTASSTDRFVYKASGGVGVALNRSLAPRYNYDLSEYVLNDRMTVYGDPMYPNIVGNNYSGYTEHSTGPYFNRYVGNEDGINIQGNYFAVFSNNGGYINNREIDESQPVLKQPSFAAVNPQSNPQIKELGRDVKAGLGNFERAFNKVTGNPLSLPFIRTMFVDRRLDFDLTILAPAINTNLRLYPLVDGKENPMERVWRGSRISGTTYGGIEMSYDDDYNIISATVDSSLSSASKNNELEYTYTYSSNVSDDAKTYYNQSPAQKRRLYKAFLNGTDIRDLFWSDSRKSDIMQILSAEGNFPGNLENGLYFYKYPSTISGLYNGDFSRETIATNYPTKRYIDVGNIPSGGYASLELTSCNYDVTTTINSDTGEVLGTVRGGESIEYELGFQSPITLVSSKNDDYANIVLEMSDSQDGEYKKFVASRASLSFSLNKYSCEGFRVYIKSPKIIKVLPYVEKDGIKYDGISYFKTVTSDGECAARGSIGSVLEHDEIFLYRFKSFASSEFSSIISVLFGGGRADSFTDNNLSYEGGYRTKAGKEVGGHFIYDSENEEFLETDSAEMAGIVFSKTFNIDNVAMFTVAIEREYQSTTDDNLSKHLNTVEISNIYDTRHILFKIDNENTFVEMIPVGVNSETTGTAPVNPPVLSEDEPQVPDIDLQDEPEEGEISATTISSGQTHVQTVSFKMKFDLSLEPALAQCETMMDISSMSYIVKFTNRENETFELSPSKITTAKTEDNDNIVELLISTKWTQDMGILCDTQWRDNVLITVIGKGKDDFIYKLAGVGGDTGFLAKFEGFEDPNIRYDPVNKKSNMEKDVKYKTLLRIVR